MKSGEVVLELVGRARPPSCALLLDELICKRIVFRQRIVPGLDQKRHVRMFQPPRASATSGPSPAGSFALIGLGSC